MSILKGEIRSGSYYDSLVLLQLQLSLTNLPGIQDAGVMMGTNTSKDVLAASKLLAPEVQSAGSEDLIIVVRADHDANAQSALKQVDEILTSHRRGSGDEDYRPKSLESAAQMSPEAQWVAVSVPGRYAAGVTRQALNLEKHVFLYSDNVPLDDEIALKQFAADKGLLVMGPDCGTAIVNGVGLGFANKVRRGAIGVVAASGTGLQQVTSRVHQLGGGITHALGTGGRDLSKPVGAVTTRQGLDLLRRDPKTQVIVLVSKPPSAEIAKELVRISQSVGKPVVVDFIGYLTPTRKIGNVHFATTFDETAELAVGLTGQTDYTSPVLDLNLKPFAPGQRFLRGIFSGGSLAYEALILLQNYFPEIYSNTPVNEDYRLPNSMVSQAHTIVDLGEDEFTVGRLHPMLDHDLRIRRLENEANDPEVAVILLDVVLGYGAHPDPASALAPAIASVRAAAKTAGRHLEVITILVGTKDDPQDLHAQKKQLKAAGAHVELSNERAIHYAAQLVQTLNPQNGGTDLNPVDLGVLKKPLAVINVGLEAFADSLIHQETPVVQVDWRPPAGGNEKLMAILERMKGR